MREPGLEQSHGNHDYWEEDMTDTRPSWDEYFMKIAEDASTRSNCLRRKVGALIVKQRNIISTGYNGTPMGRSEEHTSELQSHSFISYAVFCLKKKNSTNRT